MRSSVVVRRAAAVGGLLILLWLVIGQPLGFFQPLQPSVRVFLVINAVLALSVYLPLSAGQLSLASPGFYALGGYVAAFTATKWVKLDPDTGYWKLRFIRTFTFSSELYDVRLVLLEMVLAAVLAAVVAVILGFFALRLRGIYLALATIAFVQVLRTVTLQKAWGNTDGGGATGFTNIEQPFDRAMQYLYVGIPLLLLCAFFTYRLERGRVGRAFTAIREDELAASASGIHPTYYKVLSFTLGAVMASAGGVLAAHVLNTWNSKQGTFEAATLFLACVVIGGSRTFLGPIVGAFLLTSVPELLRSLAGQFSSPSISESIKTSQPFVYGLMMVLTCIFFPRGLVPPRIVEWLFARKQHRRAEVGS
jgi:branched-chain amino acid transport system permease protein